VSARLGRARRAGAALAALAFLVWHGAALVVAPAPDSRLVRRVRARFEPYLRLGYLGHRWTFFAPHPGVGVLVRYDLVGAGGEVTSLPLSEALERRSPAYFRFMRLFDRIVTGAPGLRAGAAAHLCRRHAAAHPHAIRFVVLRQLTLSPELVRAGVRPTDPEALERHVLEEIPCAGGVTGAAGAPPA
jgi:hypothetical protein